MYTISITQRGRNWLLRGIGRYATSNANILRRYEEQQKFLDILWDEGPVSLEANSLDEILVDRSTFMRLLKDGYIEVD